MQTFSSIALPPSKIERMDRYQNHKQQQQQQQHDVLLSNELSMDDINEWVIRFYIYDDQTAEV